MILHLEGWTELNMSEGFNRSFVQNLHVFYNIPPVIIFSFLIHINKISMHVWQQISVCIIENAFFLQAPLLIICSGSQSGTINTPLKTKMTQRKLMIFKRRCPDGTARSRNWRTLGQKQNKPSGRRRDRGSNVREQASLKSRRLETGLGHYLLSSLSGCAHLSNCLLCFLLGRRHLGCTDFTSLVWIFYGAPLVSSDKVFSALELHDLLSIFCISSNQIKTTRFDFKVSSGVYFLIVLVISTFKCFSHRQSSSTGTPVQLQAKTERKGGSGSDQEREGTCKPTATRTAHQKQKLHAWMAQEATRRRPSTDQSQVSHASIFNLRKLYAFSFLLWLSCLLVGF